jgi:nitrite reductase (NO-forming)
VSAQQPAGQPARQAPFQPLAPAVTVALLYGVAALVWLAIREQFDVSRWLALHLFTLGVLSNLVMALADHFARTLLHSQVGHGPRSRLVLLNIGVLSVLVGLPTGQRVAVGAGATLATAAVTWLYADVRRQRRRSLTSRFAFVVRGYERACGAFIHGALLGLLMGTGLLGGQWYGAARLAHLHVNLLGWGGLTLLATIVFFGPTMLRRRIEPGAEEVAARALKWASVGLSAATLALLLTGLGSPWAIWARLAAGAGLVVYAAAATSIWLPVARVAGSASDSFERRVLPVAAGWYLLVTWGDAVVVLAGAWRFLDALGAALLVGGLLQAILVALVYLGPMLRGRSPAHRAAMRERLQRYSTIRAIALNAGLILIIVATIMRDPAIQAASVAGWLLIAVAVVSSLWPLVPGIPVRRLAGARPHPRKGDPR